MLRGARVCSLHALSMNKPRYTTTPNLRWKDPTLCEGTNYADGLHWPS